MDDFYVNGYILALCLGFIKTILTLSKMFSVRIKNLEKIGIHFHPMNSHFNRNSRSSSEIFFYIFCILFLVPLTSWLTVVITVWSFISIVIKKIEQPDKIKELNYKLDEIHLSKSEVLPLQSELNVCHGLYDYELNLLKGVFDDQQELNFIDLSLENLSGTYYINPINKTFTYWKYSIDTTNKISIIYNYKFENDHIIVKATELTADYNGQESICIKDSVIQDSVLRKLCEANNSINFEHQLNFCKNELKEHKLEYYKIGIFIMSCHPEHFSYGNLIQIARHEIERITSGITKLENKAVEIGCTIVDESEEYTRIRIPPNCDAKLEEKINLLFAEENLLKFEIEKYELRLNKKIIEFYSRVLLFNKHRMCC